MKYKYENVGRAEYAIIKLDNERINSFSCNMIRECVIPGLAPCSYVPTNGSDVFKYLVTGYVTLEEFLKTDVSSRNLAVTGERIVSIVDSLKEYALDGNSILIKMNLVLVHPETLDVRMLYVPVTADNNDYIDATIQLVCKILECAKDDGRASFVLRQLRKDFVKADLKLVRETIKSVYFPAKTSTASKYYKGAILDECGGIKMNMGKEDATSPKSDEYYQDIKDAQIIMEETASWIEKFEEKMDDLLDERRERKAAKKSSRKEVKMQKKQKGVTNNNQRMFGGYDDLLGINIPPVA